MKTISVTTTAMLRPELLIRTYDSFRRHLCDLDLSTIDLRINIDPAPADRCSVSDVIDVANKFFHSVDFRCPDVPNFSSAINWLWSGATSQFILHLEDDWEMLRRGSVTAMLDIFAGNPQLQQVRFLGPSQCNTPRHIALSPGLIRRSFYSAVGGCLDETANPETQIHEKQRWPDWGVPVLDRCAALYTSKKGVRMVRDIGRAWSKSRGITKQSPKSSFVRWTGSKG